MSSWSSEAKIGWDTRTPPLTANTTILRLVAVGEGLVREVTIGELLKAPTLKSDNSLVVPGGLVLGRESRSSGAKLFSSRVMSRKHIQLLIGTDGKVYVADATSTHGTRVHPKDFIGFPLIARKPIELMDGDTLILGKALNHQGDLHEPIRLHVVLRFPSDSGSRNYSVPLHDLATPGDLHKIYSSVNGREQTPSPRTHRGYGLERSLLYESEPDEALPRGTPVLIDVSDDDDDDGIVCLSDYQPSPIHSLGAPNTHTPEPCPFPVPSSAPAGLPGTTSGEEGAVSKTSGPASDENDVSDKQAQEVDSKPDAEHDVNASNSANASNEANAGDHMASVSEAPDGDLDCDIEVESANDHEEDELNDSELPEWKKAASPLRLEPKEPVAVFFTSDNDKENHNSDDESGFGSNDNIDDVNEPNGIRLYSAGPEDEYDEYTNDCHWALGWQNPAQSEDDRHSGDVSDEDVAGDPVSEDGSSVDGSQRSESGDDEDNGDFGDESDQDAADNAVSEDGDSVHGSLSSESGEDEDPQDEHYSELSEDEDIPYREIREFSEDEDLPYEDIPYFGVFGNIPANTTQLDDVQVPAKNIVPNVRLEDAEVVDSVDHDEQPAQAQDFSAGPSVVDQVNTTDVAGCGDNHNMTDGHSAGAKPAALLPPSPPLSDSTANQELNHHHSDAHNNLDKSQSYKTARSIGLVTPPSPSKRRLSNLGDVEESPARKRVAVSNLVDKASEAPTSDKVEAPTVNRTIQHTPAVAQTCAAAQTSAPTPPRGQKRSYDEMTVDEIPAATPAVGAVQPAHVRPVQRRRIKDVFIGAAFGVAVGTIGTIAGLLQLADQ